MYVIKKKLNNVVKVSISMSRISYFLYQAHLRAAVEHFSYHPGAKNFSILDHLSFLCSKAATMFLIDINNIHIRIHTQRGCILVIFITKITGTHIDATIDCTQTKFFLCKKHTPKKDTSFQLIGRLFPQDNSD